MNRIISVLIDLNTDGWIVSVTKEFAPENGGGIQVFQEGPWPNVHRALDCARGMVTWSPARLVATTESNEQVPSETI